MAVQDTWLKRDGTRSAQYGRGLRYKVRWKDQPGRSFRTQGEAERYWLKVRTEKPASDISDATVGELVKRWLATKQGLSPDGYNACRDAAAHVLSAWRNRQAASLTEEEIQTWIATLTAVIRKKGNDGIIRTIERPASPSLKHKAIQCLSGSIKLDKLITVNPCAEIKLPRETRREARFLEWPELMDLALSCILDEDTTTVLLLGTTGARIGEVCAMNVGDVDVKRLRIRIRKSKSGRARDVPLSRYLLDRLDLDRPANEPLVTSATGKRKIKRNWRSRVFLPALKESGIQGMTIHDLRHTAVSLAIADGANVKVVQEMVGHLSATLTLDWYGHLWDKQLDDVGRRMNRRLVAEERRVRKDKMGGAA